MRERAFALALGSAFVCSCSYFGGGEASADPDSEGHFDPEIVTAALGWSWTPLEGYEFGRPEAVGDANGDGIGDAAIMVFEVGGEQEGSAYFVAGPLSVPHTFPRDEFAIVPDYSASADFNSDGVTDVKVLVEHDDGSAEYGVHYGPISGTLDTSQAITSDFVGTLDIDGDGSLDAHTNGAGMLHIWWGPVLVAGSSADVIIDFDCSKLTADERVELWDTNVHFGPDMTGDAFLDGFAPGYSWVDGCQQYVFPVPDSGTVATSSDARVVTGVLDTFAPVFDQSGDGAADLLINWDEVVASPVSFIDGRVDSNTIAAAAPLVSMLLPTDLDVNSDGIADFLGVIEQQDVWTATSVPGIPPSGYKRFVVVLEGGAAGIASDDWPTAWDIGTSSVLSRDVFLDEGHATLFVHDDHEILLFDLGTAEEVTP